MVVKLAGGRRGQQGLGVNFAEDAPIDSGRKCSHLHSLPSSWDGDGSCRLLPSSPIWTSVKMLWARSFLLTSLPNSLSPQVPSDSEGNQTIKLKHKFIYHHSRIRPFFPINLLAQKLPFKWIMMIVRVELLP